MFAKIRPRLIFKMFSLTAYGEGPFSLHRVGNNCIEKFWDMQVSFLITLLNRDDGIPSAPIV